MGVQRMMHFLFAKCPQVVREPVDLGRDFPGGILFVDAFPTFWRVWTSLFGGTNDASAANAATAANFLGDILDQWILDYGLTVNFVVDPVVASAMKQAEQQRRIQARVRGLTRATRFLNRYNSGTLSATAFADLNGRALAQGFGGAGGLGDYLLKRQRQLRAMGAPVLNSLVAAVQQRVAAHPNQCHLVQVAPHIEAEMWACHLADRAYAAQMRVPVARRRAVLVYSSDTDVLAYRPQGAAAHGRGWTWVSNVLPNQSNPNDVNYDWAQWFNDPASDVCGIWRAIRPNEVRRVLRLTVPQMTDIFILARNTIRDSDLRGMSVDKAYRMIRAYRTLEGINRMRARLNFYNNPRNVGAWQWIMANKARLRRYWTSQPAP